MERDVKAVEGETQKEVREGGGHSFLNSWFFLFRVFCQLEMSGDHESSIVLFPDALGLGSALGSVLCLDKLRLVSWPLHGSD